MVELRHIYVLLFTAGAVLALVVASIAWRYRAARGALPLAITMVGASIWSGTDAAMWYATTFEQQVFWLKMCAVGIWMVPVGILALSFEIAGMQQWRSRGRMVLISIPPLVLANLEWLNPGRLFDRAFVPKMIGPYTHYSFVPGPLYWAFVAVSQVMLIIGFVIMIRVHFRSSGTERRRTRILLIGTALPYFVNVVYQFRPTPSGDDLTPLVFLVTGVMWLIALLRGHLLTLLPLARSVLVERMSDGVVVLDGKDRVADTNPAALRMLNAAPVASPGKPAEALLGHLASAFASLRDSVSGSAGESKYHKALPINTGDNSRYVELAVVALDTGPSSSPAHLLTLHDVTEERQGKQLLKTANRDLKRSLKQIVLLKDKLQEQAIRDPLTNLHNRRFLDDILIREMARARRQGVPVSFLLLDVDNFKLINDTYSHSMGDVALKVISGILLANARVTDIACRYGGDEFLVVMPGADADTCRARAEDFRTQIGRARIVSGRDESSITVSIGVSSVPANGATADDGLAAADHALHHAKERGRNGIAIAVM